MNKKGLSGIEWFLIVILISMLAGIAWYVQGAGLFEIIGHIDYTTKDVSAAGQTWTVTTPTVGSFSTFCNDNTGEPVYITTTDTTTNTTLNLYTSVPGTGSNNCFRRIITYDVKLSNLDLRNTKKVIINRDARITAGGYRNAAWSTNTAGVTASLSSADANTLTKNVGPVVITNDGAAIRVQTNEGQSMYVIGSDPIYFTDHLVADSGTSTARSAAIQYTVTSVEVTPNINAPTDQTKPTGWTAIWAQVVAWIQDALSKLFTFSIAGPSQNITPGTSQTYQLSLPEPYPIQADYSQGVYMQRWCSAALVNKEQQIVNELPFEPCTGNWTKTYTVTMPAGAFTDYAIVDAMVETRQDYVNGVWITTYTNKVIQKESLSLTSKVLSSPTGATTPSTWSAFWTGLLSWITGLFH